MIRTKVYSGPDLTNTLESNLERIAMWIDAMPGVYQTLFFLFPRVESLGYEASYDIALLSVGAEYPVALPCLMGM